MKHKLITLIIALLTMRLVAWYLYNPWDEPQGIMLTVLVTALICWARESNTNV